MVVVVLRTTCGAVEVTIKFLVEMVKTTSGVETEMIKSLLEIHLKAPNRRFLEIMPPQALE